MEHRTSRRLFAVAALVISLAAATPAKAATIQLGFILDSSGSIGAGNWGIITNGLATALTTHIPIGGPNTYEISVVTFSDATQTVVNHVLINNAATLTAVANLISAAPFLAATTNYAAAFTAMQTALTSSPNFLAGGLSYVNFATDGAPNLPDPNPLLAGFAARNALIAAGIDNISIEGIGISPAGALLLQNNFCYPGPCDVTAPFNFPAQGFYVGVTNANEYVAAIGNKVQTVVTEVPEPTTMWLLGTGLFVAGRRLRRRT